MRELRELLVSEPGVLPALDPRPGAELRNTVAALAVASKVVALDTGVSAGQLDLQHLVDAQSLVAEAVNGKSTRC